MTIRQAALPNKCQELLKMLINGQPVTGTDFVFGLWFAGSRAQVFDTSGCCDCSTISRRIGLSRIRPDILATRSAAVEKGKHDVVGSEADRQPTAQRCTLRRVDGSLFAWMKTPTYKARTL